MRAPSKIANRPVGGLTEETAPGVGGRIRSVRLRLDRTEASFAAMLGVSPDAVQAWETGRGLDREALALIAAATDTAMEWLIAGLSPERVEAVHAAALPDRADRPAARECAFVGDRIRRRRVLTDEALPTSFALALNLRPDAGPGGACARPSALLLDLGAAALVSGARSPTYRLNRNAPTTADARILLSLVVRGRRRFEQGGRDYDGGQGSAVFVSDIDDGALSYQSDGRYVSVFLPTRSLLARAPGAEGRLAAPIAPTNPELRLIGAYVCALMGSEDGVDPDVAPSVAEHLVDLCALLLGAAGDERDLAESRGRRAARQLVAARAIHAGAATPGFSALTVAELLGVAERDVYELFLGTGDWFWDRVNARRIEIARRRLADPGNDRMTVAELAFSCGFSDFAQFDRLFAARYGRPPSEFRRARGAGSH